MKLTGGCLCGAVRFEVTTEPLAAYCCHCSMCRRASGGGMFLASATASIEGFAFTKDKPAAYESSPGNLRLFCGACGSPLGARVAEDPKLIEFNLGCLDDPEVIRPELHIFASSEVSWAKIDDKLPRYAEGGSPELEKLWDEIEGWNRTE